MRILLVEDSPNDFVLESRVIRAAGHETVWAQNGEECFKILRSEKIDAIVLDLDLPRMNGHEVLGRLRLSRWERVPVVVCTGGDTHEEGTFLTAVVMVKPLQAPRLLAAIARGQRRLAEAS
jgi:DNA-binding response OmpR family regulator